MLLKLAPRLPLRVGFTLQSCEDAWSIRVVKSSQSSVCVVCDLGVRVFTLRPRDIRGGKLTQVVQSPRRYGCAHCAASFSSCSNRKTHELKCKIKKMRGSQRDAAAAAGYPQRVEPPVDDGDAGAAATFEPAQNSPEPGMDARSPEVAEAMQDERPLSSISEASTGSWPARPPVSCRSVGTQTIVSGSE